MINKKFCRQYAGIAFAPTNLYLPGTFCSIGTGTSWNQQLSARKTPITHLFAHYDPSCWQNSAAAVYRSRSAGPSNFTVDSNEVMNSVYSGNRRFTALQRFILLPYHIQQIILCIVIPKFVIELVF